MTVIKRDRTGSTADLVVALKKFCEYLTAQGEDDAVRDLQKAATALEKGAPGSSEHKTAVATIIDAFEGDHELMAYTTPRTKSDEWTEAEELMHASTRVLNLARRMR